MPARKYPDELIDEAIRLREESGLSYALIGQSLGMSRGAVAWHCLRLGAESPKPHRPVTNTGKMIVKRGNHVVRRFSEEEDFAMLDMQAKGKSITEAAKALGRPHNSVLGRLMTLARQDERASNL